MFRLPQRGRQPAPDDPITVDPFYRRLVPAPKFIRITGAQRVIVSSDIMTTYYSWTAVYHPTDTTELGSRPRDVYPRDFGGPKNDSRIPIPPESEDSADPTVTPWPAIEASGNDSVPTDGSVIVPAWPAETGDMLIFHYEPIRLGRIEARKTSGGTTWFTWKEVEPSLRDADGHTFADKTTNGLDGTEETIEDQATLRNPLFELNQADIPVGSIVRVFRYPVRIDPESTGGYLRERPESDVSVLTYADEDSQSTQQQVQWSGFLSYEVTGATNAEPIVVTTSEPHLLGTGARVRISGVEGNTAANGLWLVTVVDSTSFELNGSTGDGSFTGSDGVAVVVPALGTYKLKITASDGDVGTSGEIDLLDDATAIEADLVASGVVTDVTVEGFGASFTVVFDDTYDHVPLMEVVDADIWTDDPYFCIWGSASRDYTWVDVKTSNYNPAVWEAVPFDISGNVVCRLPSSPDEGDRVLVELVSDPGGFAVLIESPDKIDGSIRPLALRDAGYVELIWSDDENVGWASSLNGQQPAFFPAKITARDKPDSTWLYAWVEMYFASRASLPAELSGGRSAELNNYGVAVELTNRRVALNTVVWMRRGFLGQPPSVTFTKTASGNGSDVRTAFSLSVNGAYSGTYTLILDGDETSALQSSTDDATVKSALESASGLTLSTFGGSGTQGDPWTFTVQTDYGDYAGEVGSIAKLLGEETHAFAAPGGSGGGTNWEWTGIKTADYQAEIGEAIPVQPGLNWSESITGCTGNGVSPIVLDFGIGNYHPFVGGEEVTVSGVGGNTAANGTWTISVVDGTRISLDGSTGNADWTSGGSVSIAVAPTITLPEWDESETNDQVMIVVLGADSAAHYAYVEPYGSDNCNGRTGVAILNEDEQAKRYYGNTFLFTRSPIESVGWSCVGLRYGT